MKLNRRITTLMIVCGIIGIYELASKLGILDPFLFPPVEEILPVFYNQGEKLLVGLVSSMKLLIPGFGLALSLGIALGTPFGLKAGIRKTIHPVINTLSPIPATLLTPYAIHIFADFKKASIFIIFFGAFWPIFNATIDGIATIDKEHFDKSATMELKGIKALWYMILPAAAPTILSGVATSLRFAFILLAVAEMFGANSGMGYFVQYYSDFAYFDRVLAGFIFMALVLSVITQLFEKIRERILHWTMN